ncbi:hypothetical protein I6H84_26055 [Burkholderia ambifaria]|nr:hypothetical protein [Burkholderia ambifaria]QQC06675.1 hypothetical protein I6H84_26055 [Burkholderia ambifaria]
MGFAGSATASMLDARSRSSPNALTIGLSLALRIHREMQRHVEAERRAADGLHEPALLDLLRIMRGQVAEMPARQDRNRRRRYAVRARGHASSRRSSMSASHSTLLVVTHLYCPGMPPSLGDKLRFPGQDG